MVIRAERTSGALHAFAHLKLTRHRAASLIQILQANNYTLLYTYETLEALLVYQALGGESALRLGSSTPEGQRR